MNPLFEGCVSQVTLGVAVFILPLSFFGYVSTKRFSEITSISVSALYKQKASRICVSLLGFGGKRGSLFFYHASVNS